MNTLERIESDWMLRLGLYFLIKTLTITLTITAMLDVAGAESFLSMLNECHPLISLTMELASNNKLPFLGMEIQSDLC